MYKLYIYTMMRHGELLLLLFFFFFFFFFFWGGGGVGEGGWGRGLGWLRPFQEYFTYIEPIIHQRWAKTGVPAKNRLSRTWLSHMLHERGSNHSGERVSSPIHQATGAGKCYTVATKREEPLETKKTPKNAKIYPAQKSRLVRLTLGVNGLVNLKCDDSASKYCKYIPSFRQLDS